MGPDGRRRRMEVWKENKGWRTVGRQEGTNTNIRVRCRKKGRVDGEEERKGRDGREGGRVAGRTNG